MNVTDNIEETTATQHTPDNDLTNVNDANEGGHRPYAGHRVAAIIGALLVLCGWLTMMVNEWLSLGCTLAGLVLSAIGLRVPPGGCRNLAITAIIAAAVLLLVFLLFAALLYFI
ncbi:MAG: hypothetical protein J1F20_08580 [Muribaculaceae bacterium]|nr:hypothetical protein [Muribaculaceae bacterium]